MAFFDGFTLTQVAVPDGTIRCAMAAPARRC